MRLLRPCPRRLDGSRLNSSAFQLDPTHDKRALLPGMNGVDNRFAAIFTFYMKCLISVKGSRTGGSEVVYACFGD